MATVPFTVDFTAPGALSSLTATNTSLAFDPPGTGSTHSLIWTPVTTAPENLIRIEVWSEDAFEARKVAQFTDPAVTSLLYYFPRVGIPITYKVFQIIRSGAATLIGLSAQATITATSKCLSLVSVVNPVAHRIALQAWSDFGETLQQNQEWGIPAGGQDYFEVGGSLRGTDINIAAELFNRTDGSGITALDEKLALEALFKAIPPETVCLRHPRGGKWFGRFNGSWSFPYIYGGERYRASGGFRKTSFVEGNL